MLAVPDTVFNIFLLLAEVLLYFGSMLALFRIRGTLGLGAFFCALGGLHFMETYLAVSYYVVLPFGLSLSPGSSVLFAGKLALLLLVYIREDAIVARQPIYGLLLGNLIFIGLVLLLQQHVLVSDAGLDESLSFLDLIGVLMLWSTVLLFVDCIAMILLYEHLSRPLRHWPIFTIWLTLALVLSFDQAAYFAALHILHDVPFSAGLGTWLGKMATSVIYAAMIIVFLQRFERGLPTQTRRLSDLFDTLTYRQRFEKLRQLSQRDPLTDVLHRGLFEQLGQEQIELARQTSQPLSLIMLDIDHFKEVNDRHGHQMGDEVLRHVAQALQHELRQSDYVLRYGGDEFAILAPGMTERAALELAARLRQKMTALPLPPAMAPITLSLGIATAMQEAENLTDLLALADKRLYQAKDAGRDCAVGAALPLTS
ncbi:GGDEF domain-containing protein [Xanthobacter sp. TB0139]|uniref:GGDEF domain-containing protein n=1 Tax=Xanthobacter sp. TB0139 TaxID=3459178 RepID=UPI004039CBCB